MIKLFGWERKMDERISQKREDELHYVWKRQVVGLVNGFLKYGFSYQVELFLSDLVCGCRLLLPIATMVATYATL